MGILQCDIPMHPVVQSLLTQIATSAPIFREGVRTRPHKTSAVNLKSKLEGGYEARHKELGVDVLPVAYDEGHPFHGLGDKSDEAFDPKNFRRMGGYSAQYKLGPDGKPNINQPAADLFHYNPNADVAILAHEMGHAVTAKTPIGKEIHNLRLKLATNPKLSYALAGASGLLPIGVAMATPGDDEYNQAIAGLVALNAPTLINEGLATKNALAMMNTAGMRASLGQRGMLAGGLLSYLAAPMMTATLGTAIGNQFDKDPSGL